MFYGARDRKAARLERKVDRLEGKRDVAGLAALLGHRDILVYGRARKALQRIADDSPIDPFLNVLRRSTGVARAEVIEILGKIGDPAAVPVLIPLLADVDQTLLPIDYRFVGETFSSVTASALGGIGGPAVREALIDALADEDFPALREPLLSALVVVAEPDVAAALLELLRDGQAAASALGRLSGPVARTVLIDALEGRNYLRASSPVLQALMAMSGPDTVNALAGLARGDSRERRAAFASLDLDSVTGTGGAEAVAALHDVLDPDGALRATVEADTSSSTTGRTRGDDDAAALIRLIIHDGHTVVPGGTVYRDREAMTAMEALEVLVAQRGDDVPRWVLYAGATLDNFAYWSEIDDGEQIGIRVNAIELRRLCLSALLHPDNEI
ncbi:HEAT repeat domain-containing protein [Actinomadura darangshiensis]|uniref:HEAT repeat domain-containing protein n=1 Tax=Actinomadura darangshiensis TaxID=705336 RepID=A0A4R5BMW3_9ACTN|nr:HEAT repeat domain-containing protein [Actinomadura darangshiensis]TDD86686.1 HEAT repeat domain-containing protein [Actinomadura darangshiensis]